MTGEQTFWGPNVDTSDNQEGYLLPCGCGVEYHLSDCPHLTGDYGPSTKAEWLEIMSDPNYDDGEGGY